jgi:hypothetical protein
MLQHRGPTPQKENQHKVAVVDFHFLEVYENTELYSTEKCFIYLHIPLTNICHLFDDKDNNINKTG